eukprot:gene5966-6205_t
MSFPPFGGGFGGPPGPGFMPGSLPGPPFMPGKQPCPPMPGSHLPRMGGGPPVGGPYPARSGPAGGPVGNMPFAGDGGPSGSSSQAPPRATTVYVGKIAASVPDDVIRELLEACGQIKSWNPVKEPSGASKGFGFCEYEEGEGALRSLRLLNNLKLDGQELLLKPNTATQKYLLWYEKQKEERRQRRAEEKAQQAAKKAAEAEDKAAEGKQEDANAAGGAEVDESAQEQATDDLALAIVMATVSQRSTPPPAEPPAEEKADQDRKDKELPGPPRAAEHHAHHERRQSSAAEPTEEERERAIEADFERERERKRRMEDEHRRREEREYQRRLDVWERHERLVVVVVMFGGIVSSRDREREKERERDRQKDAERERARFIKADAEARGSDDETDPWQRRSLKYHRRTEERRKRRHREMEDDAADRALEQKQLAAEAAASSKKQHLQSQDDKDAAEAELELYVDGKQSLEEDAAATDAAHEAANGSVEEAAVKTEAAVKPEVDANDGILQAMLAAASAIPPAAVSPAHQLQPQPQQPRPAAARPGSKQQRKLGVSALFGDDEEEDTKKRKLYMNEGSLSSISAWVNKKVPELVGMEEPDLVEFIMTHVRNQAPAATMDEELEPILATDATSFVMKLKRLIVYECERTALMQ